MEDRNLIRLRLEGVWPKDGEITSGAVNLRRHRDVVVSEVFLQLIHMHFNRVPSSLNRRQNILHPRTLGELFKRLESPVLFGEVDQRVSITNNRLQRRQDVIGRALYSLYRIPGFYVS